MFNLSGRVAVVTGGSSGLGVQFAHALGRQGADVVVIARRVEMLKEVAASIAEKYGVRTGYYYCDVTDSRQVAEVAEKIVADFGKIDIAVNCAGGGNCGNTEDLPDEKWHKTMDVNINGVFYCCREKRLWTYDKHLINARLRWHGFCLRHGHTRVRRLQGCCVQSYPSAGCRVGKVQHNVQRNCTGILRIRGISGRQREV